MLEDGCSVELVVVMPTPEMTVIGQSSCWWQRFAKMKRRANKMVFHFHLSKNQDQCAKYLLYTDFDSFTVIQTNCIRCLTALTVLLRSTKAQNLEGKNIKNVSYHLYH